MMTSKERMIRALHREKPDRLPVTVHQWQQYHLDNFMGGIDALAAFKATGMDASIQYFEATGQMWLPDAEKHLIQTPQWREDVQVINPDPNNRELLHTVTTPAGTLTYKTGSNPTTTWIKDYMIKRHEDVDLVEKYMPLPKLDKANITSQHDAIGDAGILRGFVWGDQAGCWQHASCLVEPQSLILETFDNPDWVHRLLTVLLQRKLCFIEESLASADFDLIETGGGAASDTVVSPDLHRRFCLPYDREIHRALKSIGFLSTYHTCGGMMNILHLILQNEADASETLSPPGVGGNISDPNKVRQAFRGKMAMIGGMDQFNVLTRGTPSQVRAEVRRLFEGFGPDGGYILSAADHFFDAPPENLRAYAAAAAECLYA